MKWWVGFLVVVLLFMLMYLVLFAAVALKMRSSTFRGTSFTIRVEVKQILGQVFYFLYYTGFLDPYLPLEMLHSQSVVGRLLEVTHNVKGLLPIQFSLSLEHCDFNFLACLNIWNLELSKLGVYNSVLSLRPISFSVTEYCLLSFSSFVTNPQKHHHKVTLCFTVIKVTMYVFLSYLHLGYDNETAILDTLLIFWNVWCFAIY